jgi:hypothetical protein
MCFILLLHTIQDDISSTLHSPHSHAHSSSPLDCQDTFFDGWGDRLPVKGHLDDEWRNTVRDKCSDDDDPVMPNVPRVPGGEPTTAYLKTATEEKSDDDDKYDGRTISPDAHVLLAEDTAAMVAVAEPRRCSGRERKTIVSVNDEAAAKSDNAEKKDGRTNEEGLVAVSGDRTFGVRVVLAKDTNDKVPGINRTKNGKLVSIIRFNSFITLIHCVCLTTYFFLQETKVCRNRESFLVGYFELKSDAIIAQAAAATKIDAYIKTIFPDIVQLTTEEKKRLSLWWQGEKKREKKTAIKKDGLPHASI